MATIPICEVSGEKFLITKEDQAFYEKMGIPLQA